MKSAILAVALIVGLAGVVTAANDKLSEQERLTIIKRAHVWRPIDTASLNLLTGPKVKDAIPFDERVTCTYDYPKKPLSGVTPKFECALSPEDVVKVKYGENNGEVFAEVAGSRLFWALGFYADRMYPVRVTCVNCPADPFRESGVEWHLGKSGTVSTRVYDPAAIERKFEGAEVEGPKGEGWKWGELDHISAAAGGAPKAHVDALKLLAVFIQHVDSKPGQQAVVCLEGDMKNCKRPVMLVKDLGSTFGEAKKMNYDKMKLDSWAGVKIWKDKATCKGDLTSSFIGTLSDPTISEAGRKFLADRLMLLSDKQIQELFTAARVDRRGDTTMDDRGGSRPATVADWVRVFKDKRAQIVNHQCPA